MIRDMRALKTDSSHLDLTHYDMKINKKLSCRKERVRLLRGSVLAKYGYN